MDPLVINELLKEECVATIQCIEKRKQHCTQPKLFPNFSDAAACNNQTDIMFDQSKVIKQRITEWANYVYHQLKSGHTITLHKLLGLYMEIHEELAMYSTEYHTTRYALLETLHLFYQNVLTAPIATKLLITGLQTISLSQPEIIQITAKILALTSDINKSYSEVQSFVVRQTMFHKASQTMITTIPDIKMHPKLLQ